MFKKYKRNNNLIEWIDSSYHIPKIFHGGKLWGGAGSYLYVSEDHWESKHLLYSFANGSTFRNILGVTEKVLLAGVDNKIMRSEDGGISFRNVLTTENAGDSFGLNPFTIQKDGTLYAATYGTKTPSNTTVFRSLNEGEEWEEVIDLSNTFKDVINDTGAHIHGIHSDPFTNDLWILLGDKPNSSILKCRGGDDVSKKESWMFESNPIISPLEFEGYPGDIYHQPIDAWFDEDYVYFSNDQRPWGVKRYNKSNGKWDLTLDYKDFGMTNMESGSYGLSMGAVSNGFLYHGSRANSPDNPSHLWRMDLKTNKWEHLWSGLPSPKSGTHGFSNIIKTDRYLIVIYHYGSNPPFIGRIDLRKLD